MSKKEKCGRLWEELGQLRSLRGKFEGALKSGNFEKCKDLRREMMQILEGPDSEISKIWLPEALRKLKLRNQYDLQTEIAGKSGLFVKEPIIVRDGQKYPMPTWNEVLKTLQKNKEIIKEKSAQGFTKMLIVPFGCNLKRMAKKFNDKVRELDQQGLDGSRRGNPKKGIFGAGGEKVKFNRGSAYYPVHVDYKWDETKLAYYPKKYDRENHGGITKEEAIKVNGAWMICFVEDMPLLPEDGKVIGGRKQIDIKGSCIKGQTDTPSIQTFHEALNDVDKMENPDKYRHERGQTPEQYLWMQLTSLLGNEKPVLMDFENREWRGSYLIEAYNTGWDAVLYAYWSRNRVLFYLGDSQSDYAPGYYSVRTSVDLPS